MEQEEQELLYKLSFLEQQMQQLQQQLEVVEKTAIDINSLSNELEELKGKTGSEIMAPVGRGIFAKAKLVSEDLLVNVGEKNLVVKSIPETQKLIKEQALKLEEAKKELNENLESIGHEIEAVIKEAEEKKK